MHQLQLYQASFQVKSTKKDILYFCLYTSKCIGSDPTLSSAYLSKPTYQTLKRKLLCPQKRKNYIFFMFAVSALGDYIFVTCRQICIAIEGSMSQFCCNYKKVCFHFFLLPFFYKIKTRTQRKDQRASHLGNIK